MGWGDGTLEAHGKPRQRAGASTEHLFLVLQCEHPTAAPSRHVLADLDEVQIGRAAVRAAERAAVAEKRGLLLRVADPWMSKVHATLQRASDHWLLEDRGSTNGTLVNGAPVDRRILADGDLLELGRTLFIFRDRVQAGPGPPDAEVDAAGLELPGMVSLLPPLQASFEKLKQLAASPLSVLISGETGTGKELVARAVHALSRRRGRFVAVNCGAIPATLVETELFGYRKGAFSGAVEDRPGLVRSADGGTLFLDEIADLPTPAQVVLLRVLQEREVLPVGATRPIPVDLRIVAASQSRLEALVESGLFRADFYARIAGPVLALPRLADRREDIGVILPALLRRAGSGGERTTFACEAARALFRHPWPLNVRELERCVETALALSAGGPVELAHLPEAVRRGAAAGRPTGAEPPPPSSPADAERREELVALLREHGGNVTAVSRAMGKARMQIQRWIKRYRLDPRSFRS